MLVVNIGAIFVDIITVIISVAVKRSIGGHYNSQRGRRSYCPTHIYMDQDLLQKLYSSEYILCLDDYIFTCHLILCLITNVLMRSF